jgi:hypothetical protein
MMKQFVKSALVVGILALATSGRAQEAVTIKVKTSKDGDSVLVARTSTVTTKANVTDGNGNVIADTKTIEGGKADYLETVIRREGTKSPTKLERSYTKAERLNDDGAVDLELAGKTVVIEKKEGKFAFAFKGGDEVMGPALDALTKEFNKKADRDVELDRLVLPKNAVKPGESWKIDMEPLVKDFARGLGGVTDVDIAKSTGTGKLIKTYKKDGMLFGVMEIKLVMPINSLGNGPGKLVFTAGAKVDFLVNQDVCIDGATDAGTAKRKMVMAGTAGVAGNFFTLEVIAEETTVQRDATKK